MASLGSMVSAILEIVVTLAVALSSVTAGVSYLPTVWADNPFMALYIGTALVSVVVTRLKFCLEYFAERI